MGFDERSIDVVRCDHADRACLCNCVHDLSP
jgi:hypothetical protein